MKSFHGSLDASRTAAVRWWRYVALDGQEWHGLLTVGQQKDKGGAVELFDYAVLETACAAAGYRKFTVAKLDANGEAESYFCQVGARGSSCTCRAGEVKAMRCKHRDGVGAAVAAGAIPAREDLPKAKAWGTVKAT